MDEIYSLESAHATQCWYCNADVKCVPPWKSGNEGAYLATHMWLPQDLRRAKPQVAFCLPNGWCAACLSAKPRIFTRNTLTTDVFFRLFFLR